MFKPQPHSSSELSIRLQTFLVKKEPCSISNSFLIIQDLRDRGPLIWNLAMSMTILWVINIRIDATFENLLVRTRLGGRIAGRSCQMNIQEGWNVA